MGKEKETQQAGNIDEKEVDVVEENNNGNGGNEQDGQNNDVSGVIPKTYTQEQLQRIINREKNNGRNSVYDELGIDTKNKQLMDEIKTFIESKKTDGQKQAENIIKENAIQAELEKKLQIAEAKAEAMMMGVKPQYVEDLIILAISKLSDDTDLKTIIGEFKTKYSVWFNKSDDDEGNDKNKKAGQKGTGNTVKGKDSGASGEKSGMGARLAAQRAKGNTKKSSYWSAK